MWHPSVRYTMKWTHHLQFVTVCERTPEDAIDEHAGDRDAGIVGR